MKLIIDANILFSALIKEGTTRHILLFSEHEFFMPEYALEEFEKHFQEIKKKTNLNGEKLNELINELIKHSEIKIILLNEFEKHKKSAEEISPDFNDSAYIALAIHLKCAIWSNDKLLKNQNKIKIISTKELIKLTS